MLVVTVIWRQIALKQQAALLTYINREFGKKSAKKAHDAIKHCETLLARNPYMGSAEDFLKENKLNYRSLVVHKHTKLIYYLNDSQQTLYIAALWDTRREPSVQACSTREE